MKFFDDNVRHCLLLESLTRCLYCVDNVELESDKSSPRYDKLGNLTTMSPHV